MTKLGLLLLLLLGPSLVQVAKAASEVTCDEAGMIMECCRQGAGCSIGMDSQAAISNSDLEPCSCAVQPLEPADHPPGISSSSPTFDLPLSGIDNLQPQVCYVRNQLSQSRGNPPPRLRQIFLLNTSLLL